MPFAVEEIPDEDLLFLRVHKINVQNNKLLPIAYKIKGEGGLSTDWSRYSTPQQSRERARIPSDNGVVSFEVKSVRKGELKVLHCPIEGDLELAITPNQAHSEIHGIPSHDPDKTKIRLLLGRIYKWEIDFDE